MARELMPKSGIMMPYVVVTRDAAVVGVSTVDGRAGSLDLVSMGYAKAADYYKKTETYTKTEVDNLITPIMQRALFKDDPFINNNVALRSGGGNGIVSVDMIKVDPQNNIIVGDYDAGVQGVHIYSEGKVDVVYKDSNGQEKSAPLYSDRFRPPVADLPFAAIGQYVTDPTTGRTIGVNRTGENSDLKTLNALTNIKTTKVTFEQSPTVPDAAQPYDAVNLRQLQAAGGGGGANMTGVMNNFIGAVEWFNGSRASIPSGYVAADGQVLSRVKYPDLSTAIDKGFLNSITEDLWISSGDPDRPTAWRSSFSRGGAAGTAPDGSTPDLWMRAPDLNGIQASSVKHLFLSGSSGSPNEPGIGQVWTESIPNLSGQIAPSSGVGGSWIAPVRIAGQENKALSVSADAVGMNRLVDSALVSATAPNFVEFNANRESKTYGRGPAYQTNPNGNSSITHNIGGLYPNHAVGIWIIRASGAFTAANSNFSVIAGDATLPPTGTVVEGGALRSVYSAGGSEHMSATLTMRRAVGSKPFARLWIKSTDLGDATTWDFPLNQQWNAFGTASTKNVVSFAQVPSPTTTEVMLQNSVDFRGITSYAVMNAYPMGVTSGIAKGTQGWGRQDGDIVGVLSSRNWPDNSGANSCFQIGCNEQIGLAYKRPQYSSTQTYLSDAIIVRDTRNTTVDGSGFIKAASPIVKLFGDGSKELNEDARGAKTERLSKGVYRVSGVLGFNSDAAWSGIDGGYGIPKNGNELPLIWLDYEIEADGSIIVKTYHRTHPSAPPFARNEIDGYAEADPIDIPKGRWVDLRVHMPDAK